MNKLNRPVSQVTHILCAKCGADIALDNRYDSDILTYEDMNCDDHNQLIFTCPSCNVQYDLPCKMIRY